MTIEDVLRHHGIDDPALRDHLIAREDGIADLLRLAGAQFGLYPGVVARVLMDVGLGTPPTPEMRETILRQFNADMEDIQRRIGEG